MPNAWAYVDQIWQTLYKEAQIGCSFKSNQSSNFRAVGYTPSSIPRIPGIPQGRNSTLISDD
jgi:hypothetical protein